MAVDSGHFLGVIKLEFFNFDININRGTLTLLYTTVVFSRSSGVGFNSLEDIAGVPDDLPDQLDQDGAEEAEHPVADVVCAPEEVQDQAQHQDDEGVGVEHVLGAPRPVPLLHEQRPPGSLVPSHGSVLLSAGLGDTAITLEIVRAEL